MSAGEIAGLVAAFAFVLLVGALMIPILKLGRTVDELTETVRTLRTEHVAKSSTTVDETNALLASVNTQVARVDAIASNAQVASTNVAALTSVAAATFGSPLVRVAAFSYGVRSVMADRREKRLSAR
jgi:uncharacterized protein YoxC